MYCNVYICIFCCSIPLKELRANNRLHQGFRGVIKDSAVSLRPLNPLQRSHWNRRICFCSLIETAESASVVSLRPLNPLPWCHWNRGSKTFQPLFYAENYRYLSDEKIWCWSFYKDSAVSLKPRNPLHWNRSHSETGQSECTKLCLFVEEFNINGLNTDLAGYSDIRGRRYRIPGLIFVLSTVVRYHQITETPCSYNENFSVQTLNIA
jgi:hypothetical protein